MWEDILRAILGIEPASAQSLGISPGPPAAAYTQTNISSAVTAPNSTSAYVMMGLAGSIQPVTTGVIEVTISGTINAPAGTTATFGMSYQISMGSGGAPSNRASLTGTQYGIIQTDENAATITAADYFRPFSISCIVTGLSVGTAYWIDLAAKALGASGDHSFSTVSITAIEQSR